MRMLVIALLVTALPAAAYPFQAPKKPVMTVAATTTGIAAPASAAANATPAAKPAERADTHPNSGNDPSIDRKYDPPLCASPATADWNPAVMANGAACSPTKYAGLGQSRG
jgi:hypothetical protein